MGATRRNPLYSDRSTRMPDGPTLRPQFTVSEVEITAGMIALDHLAAPGLRRHRQARSLCDRHGWACAIIETELMPYAIDGAASRLPARAGIAAASALVTPKGGLRARPHRPMMRRPSCPICARLRVNHTDGPLATRCFERAATVNTLTATTWWVKHTQAVWQPIACPNGHARNPGGDEGAAVRLRYRQRHGPQPSGKMRQQIVPDYARLAAATARHVRDDARRGDGGVLVATCFAALGRLYGWATPLGILHTADTTLNDPDHAEPGDADNPF